MINFLLSGSKCTSCFKSLHDNCYNMTIYGLDQEHDPGHRRGPAYLAELHITKIDIKLIIIHELIVSVNTENRPQHMNSRTFLESYLGHSIW